MNSNLAYVETGSLTHEQWEELRRSMKTIGGSDAATIIGLNEYSSPYSLWCQKTGRITPADLSDKEAVRLGTDLEEYVATRWCERTGKKVRRRNAVIQNPDYIFAHANVDRLVVGEDAILECKTTSSWDIIKHCRAGTIPPRYYCQMVHYLAVTGASRCYLGVLCFSSGFYDFVVERDEAEISALMGSEREFYALIENDTPPAVDGSDATTEALDTVYSESVPGVVDLTGVGQHIDLYNAIGKQIKELETLQAEHENAIKSYMGEAEKGTFGSTSVSWKSGSRKTFDKAAYEKANGAIPDSYYKTTQTRTFRVTNK